MDPKDTKFKEMRILICELVDGTITPERKAELNQILATDPDAVNHYVDFLDIQVLIKSNMSNIEDDFSTPLYSDEIQELAELWRQLAKEERSAPEVDLPKEQPPRELIQKVIYPPREKRNVSKFGIIFLAMNAAAILFFFLFLRFAPSTQSVEVATLTDSIDAKWSGDSTSLDKGVRMVTGNKPLQLREGYAELRFDNQTRVTLEGPAEFQLLADDQLKLIYGRLYAVVPAEAIGFTVKTPSAQIVDLGTEFGVDCSLHSDTSLHVMKGKTVLIAGSKSNKVSIEVQKGVAKKVLAVTQTVSDIPCNDRLFAREISSASRLVWRGETEVSLADIVGGGNGFGTGQLNYGIMIETGKLSTEPLFIGNYNIHYEVPRSVFRSVSVCAAVDGIFVPDSGFGKVVVSSQGHTFDACPDTTATWCVPIINGAQYKPDSDAPFQINGQSYGTREKPGLFLHANIGITYDLNVIRSQIPADKILARFSSIASSLDTAAFGTPGLVDIWILVDGQVRFSKTDMGPSEFLDLDIPLSQEDRFLSLVVTDGVNDRSVGQGYKDGFDWILFGTPELVIESFR